MSPLIGAPVVVDVNVATVRRGDQVLIGARTFTVVDMIALHGQRRRLDFENGESFTMTSTTELRVTRWLRPRRAR